MTNKTEVLDGEVIANAPVAEVPVATSLDLVNVQAADFQGQLEQVKKDMAKHQQAFEQLKNKGLRLEGALESLSILRNSLSK